MTHELYEIWEPNDGMMSHPIALQLHDYAAYFETREKAEKYRDMVKDNRKKNGLK